MIGVCLDGGVDLLDGTRLAERVIRAEEAGFDFVALADTFDPPVDRAATSPARGDALLSLARVAPLTSSIGLLPTVTTTHTEPFHISKNVATLDLVSGGRGGWRVAVSTTDEAAALFGRKGRQSIGDLIDEAADAIEVVRGLWDSWEDDAVIRDQPTGRYIDRDKIHYVDFEGRFFSVRGPSITPRPPQGQPIVAVDVDRPEAVGLAALHADIAIIEAEDIDETRRLGDELRALAAAGGREPSEVKVIVRHHVRLAGNPSDAVRALSDIRAAEIVDGVLLTTDPDSTAFGRLTEDVMPQMGTAGVSTVRPRGITFRDRLGLDRPANRYATSAEARR